MIAFVFGVFLTGASAFHHLHARRCQRPCGHRQHRGLRPPLHLGARARMGEYRTGLHRGACHRADARHEDVGRHLPVHLPHPQRGQPRPRQFHQRHPLRPGQRLQPGATLPRGLHCGRDLRLPQGRLHQHTRLPPRLRTLARRGAVGRLRQSAHWSGSTTCLRSTSPWTTARSTVSSSR